MEENKVIRPESRASALTKIVRQTDRQIFFSKRLLKWPFVPQRFFSIIQGHEKRFKKPLKQFCDGRTDRPTDGPTDRPKSGL